MKRRDFVKAVAITGVATEIDTGEHEGTADEESPFSVLSNIEREQGYEYRIITEPEIQEATHNEFLRKGWEDVFDVLEKEKRVRHMLMRIKTIFCDDDQEKKERDLVKTEIELGIPRDDGIPIIGDANTYLDNIYNKFLK